MRGHESFQVGKHKIRGNVIYSLLICFPDSEIVLVASRYSPRYTQYSRLSKCACIRSVKISQYMQTQSQAFTVHI